METDRIIAVGDIHGCRLELERLLGMIPFDPSRDLLVLLGDYIDRGPEPRGVLEILSGLVDLHPGHVRCLMGNHEWMFLRYLEGKDTNLYLLNGGETTIADYFIQGKGVSIPDRHKKFLDSLEFFLETESYIFVHAGLRPGVPLADQTLDDLLWIRDEFISSSYDWGKRVVFAHTPVETPLVQPNKIGIDTGAVYGGRLTALILPDLTFISVEKK
ncbi:MAG: serine/threonine protein phosphatase [Deltaproteobacteria bacterium]